MAEHERTETHIRCLECGRWLRSLANHLRPAHGMTAEQYKLAHGLLMSEPLVPDAWRTAVGDKARKQVMENPSAGSRAMIEGRLPQRSYAANASREAERKRQFPDYHQARAERQSEGITEANRARHDDLARAAGFDSWESLLRATVHESAASVGKRIGLSEMPVSEARRAVLGDDWVKRFKRDWRGRGHE